MKILKNVVVDVVKIDFQNAIHLYRFL